MDRSADGYECVHGDFRNPEDDGILKFGNGCC